MDLRKTVSKVKQSLESVRLLASRPAALLDAFALLGTIVRPR